MTNMRIILCANSTSKLIAPIKSRCLLVRVAAPNDEEVWGNSFSQLVYDLTLAFPCFRCRLVLCMLQRKKSLIYHRKQLKRLYKTQMEIYEKQYSFSRPSKCNRMCNLVGIFMTSLIIISFRPDLSGPLTIAKPDWETYCHKVADMIVAEQSPQRVMDVRAKFYELLSHCIPPTVILKVRFLTMGDSAQQT